MNNLNLDHAELISNAKSVHGFYKIVMNDFLEQLYKHYKYRRGLSENVITEIGRRVNKKLTSGRQ